VLTDAEARALADDPAPDVEGLCADARARRLAARGVVVTYSPKVFIPLTVLCRDRLRVLHLRPVPVQDPRAVSPA